ncbi:MAG: hypothetical protein R3E95_05800 [Thiolinea sp.]
MPHPRLGERSFVLWPLLELAPDLQLPDGTALQDCRAALPGDDLQVLDEPLWPLAVP